MFINTQEKLQKQEQNHFSEKHYKKLNKMSRSEIEKQIISKLSPKLEEKGFLLKSENYRGEHYAEFVKKDIQAEFTFTIFFLKYGRINFFLSINYPIIDILYGDEIKIFKVYINRYLHPKNNDDYFNSGQTIDSKHSNEIIEGKELDKVVEYILEDVFEKTVPNVSNKLNSLEKASSLVNDISTLFKGNEKEKMLIFSTSYPDEVLAGVLLAEVTKHPNKDELFITYRNYSNQFELENGANETISEVRNLMQKYLNP